MRGGTAAPALQPRSPWQHHAALRAARGVRRRATQLEGPLQLPPQRRRTHGTLPCAPPPAASWPRSFGAQACARMLHRAPRPAGAPPRTPPRGAPGDPARRATRSAPASKHAACAPPWMLRTAVPAPAH
eukprot:scaffold36645_cov67-Phaeocystis_antarctica.AAC.2